MCPEPTHYLVTDAVAYTSQADVVTADNITNALPHRQIRAWILDSIAAPRDKATVANPARDFL